MLYTQFTAFKDDDFLAYARKDLASGLNSFLTDNRTVWICSRFKPTHVSDEFYLSFESACSTYFGLGAPRIVERA
jgi:hypothetical protein